MIEEARIKRELIKNVIITFIIFLVIFLLFDLIIYNQISNILYKSIDEELLHTAKEYQDALKMEKILGFNGGKINPRIITIIRGQTGTVINEDALGRMYDDYLYTAVFDMSNMNKIYNLKINEEFYYRGINITFKDATDNTIYVQLLANVDGEKETIKNLFSTLLIGTAIIMTVAIIASYELGKRTLQPIMQSWEKQTEFVQNVSHELRTPLTILQAKQELLLQEPNSKILDKSEDINISLQETRRLTKMIKELMLLSTSDSNKMILEKENTDIDKLIKEIVLPYADFAEMQNKKLNLELECKKNIKIDRNKISQVIIILLDNAIKYTAENEDITIKTYIKDGKCVIEVNDTGIGISKEGLKHVFERFYREDKARSRETGGTGLGLSIAFTIIKLHGGNIKAVQNEPKGTKMIIKLPGMV